MKNLLNLISIVALVIFISCGGDNGDDIKVDCSKSDLAVSVSSTTAATCSDLGQLVVSSTGGSGNVEYSVDGVTFQATTSFDLGEGSYAVTVKDSNGCEATVAATVAGDANAVTISDLAVTNSSCTSSTGSITVTASGGSGAYMYKLNEGAFQNSSMFSNVASGTHTVTVKDDQDCETSSDKHVPSNISLSGDIVSIITANCAIASCHGGTQSPNLSGAAAIRQNADRINARAVEQQSMPPASRPDLSSGDIAKIACWIADGAPNN